MILIADSGSTKTSWCFYQQEKPKEFFYTGGINPFFCTTNDIVDELGNDLLPKIKNRVKEVHFYGAGVVNDEKAGTIKNALQKLFPGVTASVQSDLLAAAHSTLGTNDGIACILGTGSNSCQYNGKEITAHIPPLGFILGDEGSGAVLGRKLVGDYLKKIMPVYLASKFQQKYLLQYPDFLSNVYKKEKPNKFLAGFVPFLKENIGSTYCENLVVTAFEEFFTRNIEQYPGYRNQTICFAGSVAYYFQEQIKKVFTKKNLTPGTIIKEPLLNLLHYHLQNSKDE